jgi:hypothetical protein
MKTVHKYKLEKDGALDINEAFEIQMPKGASILSTQLQVERNTTDPIPVMWAEVETDNEMEPRRLWLITSGAPLPNIQLRYIGTLLLRGGSFAPHLFEELKN